jgi:hypothetical protein
VLSLGFAQSALSAFDHEHRAWTELLKKHVVLKDGGKASQVRYAGFANDREALKRYLDILSAVPEQDFKGWSKDQQLAFLINAYNAYTVEKILTRYPKLNSIRDFGNVFGNPWKDRFFKLLGKDQNLDGIEHETIRAPGAYDDPRAHFAVNCASIGCPMLREEAFIAGRLDKQLEEQTLRFLSDRSRNRYNPQSGKLEVSSIFKWYGEDFARGWKGFNALDQFMSKYAAQLTDKPEEQLLVRERKAKIDFLDYDWALNAAR